MLGETMSIVGIVVSCIIGLLYALVGLLYVTNGLVFSRIWHYMVYAATFDSSIDYPQDLNASFFSKIHPVFSNWMPLGWSWIIFVIGAALMFTATSIAFGTLAGLIGVLFFSVMEVILGITFYWKRDRNLGIRYVIIHGLVGLIALGAWLVR